MEPLVLAFDGDCLMCNRSVRFLAERDRRKRLRFVPLQSPLGREMEQQAGSAALSTILVKDGQEVLIRSEGAFKALEALGGGWAAVARLARLVPRPLRDAAYDFIARRRIAWFGKADACALPSEAVRERLIAGERV